jgi:hypothetical protein
MREMRSLLLQGTLWRLQRRRNLGRPRALYFLKINSYGRLGLRRGCCQRRAIKASIFPEHATLCAPPQQPPVYLSTSPARLSGGSLPSGRLEHRLHHLVTASGCHGGKCSVSPETDQGCCGSSSSRLFLALLLLISATKIRHLLHPLQRLAILLCSRVQRC